MANIVQTLDAATRRETLDIRRLVEPTDWTNVTYAGTWVDYASGYQGVQYRKVGDVVQVRGSCKNGSLSSPIFTLPAGFRPPLSRTFPAWTLGNILGAISVTASTGVVAIGANGGTGYVELAFEFSVTA